MGLELAISVDLVYGGAAWGALSLLVSGGYVYLATRGERQPPACDDGSRFPRERL